MTELPLLFCCVGPQRTASSWLQEVLQCHPNVCLPRGVKETMFFDSRFAKGQDWYNWHFNHAKEGQKCGEIAPTYFDSREACDRIALVQPDIKIIIMVRNPIERAFSLYRHHLSKGRIRMDFQNALLKHPDLISSGKYAEHSTYWESTIPRNQILYVWQDQVITNPESVLNIICDFIDIPRLEKLPAVASNVVNHATAPRSKLLALAFSSISTALRSASLYKVVDIAKSIGLKSIFAGGKPVEPLTPEIRKQLAAEFESDIAWLENHLGRDLTDWR